MPTSQISTLKRLKLALYNFTKKEVLELGISCSVLAFMIALGDLVTGKQWLITFIIGLSVTSLSLFIHHLVQKFVANKYDCITTYSINYNLLLIGLLIALLTNGAIVFAAPGAIIISAAYFTRLGYKFVNITTREKGIIALSGPVSNIILALTALIIYPLNPVLLQQMININIFIALFNMLPFPPLNGNMVFWWNRMSWFIGLMVPVFMFFFAFNILFALIGGILVVVIIFILWQAIYPAS